MEESSGGQYHMDMNSHVRKVIGSRTFLVKNNLDAEEACQRISLSHNQVQTFQFSSPNCPLLSTLLLNDNDRLQEIPDSFFKNMTRLRVLDLSSTSITSLPSSISCLCELQLLKLQSCHKLEGLPTFLKYMRKLEILDLHQTALTKMLEASFYNMQSLRRLDISGACNLRRLSLQGCRSLMTLANLDKLSKLEALDLSGTKLEVLPHQIFSLTSMQCLDLLAMEHLKTGGRKDRYGRFKRNQFLYQHIYTQSEQSLSYERGLEVCGGNNSLDGVRGVLSMAKFFHLYGNASIMALSNLGMEMDNLKECWIEKCHQLELLFVGRMADIDAAVCLENLRVSDLAKLITVRRGKLGRGGFACLKHIYLECCPKLINFFSSSIRLQNLELVEIKFCCRLEKVFEEDSEVGQNAFP
ncbi:putative disease resistance protein At4g19050 [Magnolia sinica]|uniref:putative disease resistance protein At4g19050 n=1 Tax=Magnolia sinica TaxID=86752 RepID=UPI00265A3374|nr:putative disease resistance protein At4g19050 [Magnolia sinica]